VCRHGDEIHTVVLRAVDDLPGGIACADEGAYFHSASPRAVAYPSEVALHLDSLRGQIAIGGGSPPMKRRCEHVKKQKRSRPDPGELGKRREDRFCEPRSVQGHHMGAMLPHFEGRAGHGLDQLGTRTDDPDDLAAGRRLTRRPVDYFRMFYGDTALFGAAHAMECGLAFFGADHVLFGTDMPFDPERGPGFIRETIAAMERMRATPEEKAKIYEGNARRMLRLRLV
jgi:hypothetical protein